MPAGSPPHKDTKGILKASLRYDMVKMAIASYKDFEISDYEIKKQGYSYTFETLNYLSSPDNKIFFITGADCLMDIEKWREPEKILSTCNFVVFNRSGYNKELLINQKEKIEKKYKTNISFLDTIDLEISSSMVRERIKNNKRVDFFVPKEVLDFIKKNQLYEG